MCPNSFVELKRHLSPLASHLVCPIWPNVLQKAPTMHSENPQVHAMFLEPSFHPTYNLTQHGMVNFRVWMRVDRGLLPSCRLQHLCIRRRNVQAYMPAICLFKAKRFAAGRFPLPFGSPLSRQAICSALSIVLVEQANYFSRFGQT